MLVRPAVLAIALALAGCASSAHRAPPGPPEYREGYAAGCDSGLSAAGNPYYRARRDWAQYENNARYKTGWTEGFQVCKERYERRLDRT